LYEVRVISRLHVEDWRFDVQRIVLLGRLHSTTENVTLVFL
jgi:hypothetical protein